MYTLSAAEISAIAKAHHGGSHTAMYKLSYNPTEFSILQSPRLMMELNEALEDAYNERRPTEKLEMLKSYIEMTRTP